MDYKSYNSGNPLDENTLMGGMGATEIGEAVFGNVGQQERQSNGGNSIQLHQQYGGKRRSRKSKKSKRKTQHKRKTVSATLGGRRKGRKGKKSRSHKL